MNTDTYSLLANGTSMPLLGFGTAQLSKNQNSEEIVSWALRAGYRLIDSASKYGTEAAVGSAVRHSGIPREEIYVTTKIWTADMRSDRTEEAFQESLERLKLSYVDMLMLHWPVPGKYTKAWRALEHIYEQGLTRAIGVSNFTVRQLEDLMTISRIDPMVNQCECHPRFANPEVRDFCQKKRIVFQSYQPLGHGIYRDHPVISRIAEAHGRNFAQVLIRWQLQNHLACIPKSAHKDYVYSNYNVFDFDLSEDEMEKINGLNENKSTGDFTPDCFDF